MKIFSFVLLLFISIINAKASFATTLKEALALAYKNSETVGISGLQKDFAKIDRDTAWFNLLPSATLGWQMGRSFDTTIKYGDKITSGMQNFIATNHLTLPHGMGNTSGKIGIQQVSANATASLSYYKIIPGIVMAHKAKNAKDFEYKEFLENFGLLFIQKYMDVIFYTKSKDVYTQMSDTLEKKLRRVSVMNKYGTAKKDKVVLAEAQLYENKANEITTNSALEKAKMDYKIMTGEKPDNLEVPDLTNAVLPAKNKNDFIALVLVENSKLLRVRMELTAQKLNLTTQSLNILPDIFFNYSYTDSKNGDYMKYHYHTIALGVSWTINGSNNLLNRARKEYKSYRIADLNYALTKKEIEQDASYSWDQYYAMLELVKATQKALKASKDSLQEVKVSVSTGTATFIDEMDVENQYLNANLNYLNAIRSLTLAYYKLVSMTGVGYLTVI